MYVCTHIPTHTRIQTHMNANIDTNMHAYTQDQLVLQMLRVMDRELKMSGLDLRLTPCACPLPHTHTL